MIGARTTSEEVAKWQRWGQEAALGFLGSFSQWWSAPLVTPVSNHLYLGVTKTKDSTISIFKKYNHSLSSRSPTSHFELLYSSKLIDSDLCHFQNLFRKVTKNWEQLDVVCWKNYILTLEDTRNVNIVIQTAKRYVMVAIVDKLNWHLLKFGKCNFQGIGRAPTFAHLAESKDCNIKGTAEMDRWHR